MIIDQIQFKKLFIFVLLSPWLLVCTPRALQAEHKHDELCVLKVVSNLFDAAAFAGCTKFHNERVVGFEKTCKERV